MRKSLKRGTWKGLELFLGGVLGEVWRLWRPRGSIFGIVFSCLYLGWTSKALLEGSGLDFASILGGLGGILGGIWPGFDSDFKGFWVILDFSCSLAGSMACFCLLGPAWACFG